MGIMKGFTFDGVRSLDHHVYLTGSAVYDAPARDVEMIVIAGRDGEYAMDKGRFENIEIPFPAGMFGTDQPDFAEKISDFRNLMVSRRGYKRLEDDYHPDEYRMAIYKSGLSVDPVANGKAGEFELVFNCKPQRFLKSGEVKQTIANGGTLNNPTLFDSHPLLEVYEYGEIHINDETINLLSSRDIGEVILANRTNYRTITFDSSILNTGDAIMVGRGEAFGIRGELDVTCDLGEIDDVDYVSGDQVTTSVGYLGNRARIFQEFTTEELTLVKGTPFTLSKSQKWKLTTTRGATTTPNVTTTVSYDGDGTISVVTQNSVVTGGFKYFNSYQIPEAQTIGEVIGVSTKPTGGNPTYIDLEIGEAYKIENGKMVSLNKFVELPAELPVLKAGNNTITFDNTITQLDITPRWYKI